MKKGISLVLAILFLLSFICSILVKAEVSSDDGLVAYWKQTGTNHIQISDFKTLIVNVTNGPGSFESFYVKASCNVSGIHISQPWQEGIRLAPQETVSVTFTVSNSGVEEQIDNIPITIDSSMEVWWWFLVSRNVTVYATLLATLRPGQTTLNMSAIEMGTGKPADGVQLNVLYPSNGQGEQKETWTDSKGDASLLLDMPHGGAYLGDIEIQILESDDYYPQNITSTVDVGFNEKTFLVEPKNPEYDYPDETPEYDYPDETNWAFLLAIAVIIINIILVVIIILQRRK